MPLISRTLFAVRLDALRMTAGEVFPPLDDDIAISRFEFCAVATAVELFAGNERAARAEEGIEYDVVGSRAVAYPSCAQFDRLHRRMHFRPQRSVYFPDLGLLAIPIVAAFVFPTVETRLVHPLVLCRR